MSDNISRQSALDALRAIRHGLWEIDIPSPASCPEYVEHHEQIKSMMGVVDGWIKKISEEEPASDWVPCSERLPDEYDEYLCQYEDGDIFVGWLEDAKWCRYCVRKDKVVAWMPLPEPYKGENNER